MARIRSIHPGFFTDQNIVAVSAFARILFLGLGVEADDKGIFEWKPLQLKMRLFPADNVDVAGLLAELEEVGSICKYDMNGRPYGAIRNFRKFQRPKTPNSLHPITPEIEAYVGLVPPKAETQDAEAKPFPPKAEIPPQMEDGGGNREEEKEKALSAKAPTRKSYSEAFEGFWKNFPTDKGMSKLEAWKAWGKLTPDEQVDALEGISGFRDWVAKQGKDYRTVHACRYLSQKRFDGFKTLAGAGLVDQVFVAENTAAWAGWLKYRGREPPRVDRRTDTGMVKGWYFPTEFPPADLMRKSE